MGPNECRVISVRRFKLSALQLIHYRLEKNQCTQLEERHFTAGIPRKALR